MKKMDRLSEKHPKFACGAFPPCWDGPLSEDAVARYEADNRIVLPKDYRRFITTTAASGTQPFYGLYDTIGKPPEHEEVAAADKKFPYTVRNPLNISKFTQEEYEAFYSSDEIAADCGFLLLCHEGCGMYSILIVNTDDNDTFGTVWFYDLANDWGIYPLIDPVNKSTMSFLDWLEYYADKTLELGDDEYFSYGALSGYVEE